MNQFNKFYCILDKVLGSGDIPVKKNGGPYFMDPIFYWGQMINNLIDLSSGDNCSEEK